MRERRNDLEIVKGRANCFARSNSDRSPLYDVRKHARRVHPDCDMRIDVSRTIIRACRQSTIWWSQTGSNRRPHACKARALPAELWPRNQKTNAAPSAPAFALRATARQPSPSPGSPSRSWRSQRRLVGLGRLELPTSRLSSARSNQLSYKPLTLLLRRRIGAWLRARPASAGSVAQALSPWRVFVREERETKTAKSRQWDSTILKLLAPDVSKTIR
jgi:hypothetical protein